MTGNLLELADKIVLSAHRLAVPDQRLKVARDALQRTNSPSSQMDAVNGLEAVAMEVQEEARDQRIILQRPAVQLAAACQSYLKASDAMVTVQRAATERARERETAPVTLQNVQPPQPGADPGPGQVRLLLVREWIRCSTGHSAFLLIVCSSLSICTVDSCRETKGGPVGWLTPWAARSHLPRT